MIKEYNKIYTLGGLYELLMKKLKPIFEQIKIEKTNQSLDDFLFGEKTKMEDIKKTKAPADTKERYWVDNFYYYVDIANSFERLYISYAFLCKFPKFRYYNLFRINELTWVRYHIEFYLQESYILKQRTIGWLIILRILARRKSKPNLENKIFHVIKFFDKAFKTFGKIRGAHVHSYRYQPKEFSGIDALNLLISHGKMKELTVMRKIKLAFLILDWKKTIISNNKELIKIYDTLYKFLRKILIELE